MTLEQVLSIDRVPRWDIKGYYRIGLIGVGGIASSAHLPAYQEARFRGMPGGFEVVAVADINPTALERARRVWGISSTYLDFREMLEKEKIDIVDITISWRESEAKLSAVQCAAEKGVHILVQKPIASTYPIAEAMVEAAEREGVFLAVNQNSRWASTFYGVKRLVEEGAIGQPIHILLESRFPNRYPDMVLDFSVHTFDLIRSIIGQTPKSLIAYRSVAPDYRMCVSVLLQFDDPLTGVALENTCVNEPEAWRVEVSGTEGQVRGQEQFNAGGAQNMPPSLIEWIGDACRGSLVTLRSLYRYLPDAFIASMADLMQAIEKGQPPVCSGRDNLLTLKCTLSAIESYQSLRMVSLS